jgi:hypothetical protein
VIAAKPPTSSTAVVARVSLVWRLQRDGELGRERSSSHTGKPRPPTITPAAIGRRNQPSVAKPTRLSG